MIQSRFVSLGSCRPTGSVAVRLGAMVLLFNPGYAVIRGAVAGLKWFWGVWLWLAAETGRAVTSRS